MPRPKVFELQGFEQADLPIRARVTDADGTALLRAGISSIAYIVKNAAGTTTASGSLTVNSVISDTLSSWIEDATGYNFAATIPAAAFPDTGHHRVQIKFTLANGSITYLLATAFMLSVATS